MINKTIKILILTLLMSVLAVPAMAQTVTPVTPNPGLACMHTAVEVRDNAIIAGWDALYASGKSALEIRRDALSAAWDITNKKERRVQLAKAWSDFRYSARTARRTFNGARDAAWQKFKNDALSCRKLGAPITDDTGIKSYDINL